jgi:hypothetical protein
MKAGTSGAWFRLAACWPAVCLFALGTLLSASFLAGAAFLPPLLLPPVAGKALSTVMNAKKKVAEINPQTTPRPVFVRRLVKLCLMPFAP